MSVTQNQTIEKPIQNDKSLDLSAIFSPALKNRFEQAFANDKDYSYYQNPTNLRENKRNRIRHIAFETKLHDESISQSRIHRNRHALYIHKNMIKVKVESPLQDGGKGNEKRGNVTKFSRKSRKRMIELMNSQKHGTPATFVTLTYPDEVLFTETNGIVNWISEPSDWKNNLEVLRKRIEKQFPGFRAIWRIELQDRKSGNYLHSIAPHFHLLVWDFSPTTIVQNSNEDTQEPETFSDWLHRNWFEIVGSGLEKHLKNGVFMSKIKSHKHAMFYVSKYVAKSDGDIGTLCEIGRRWGRIGQFDTDATIILIMSEKECNQFKRLLRSYLKSIDRKYYKKLAKSRSDKGFAVYGLGDENFDLWNSSTTPITVRLYYHAKAIDHEIRQSSIN